MVRLTNMVNITSNDSNSLLCFVEVPWSAIHSCWTLGVDHSTNQGRVPGAFRPLVGHRKLQRTSLGIREGSLDKTTGFEHVESPAKSSCVFIVIYYDVIVPIFL